jgi:ABC-type transport system involved in cytochrome c biogenesis permease subunit
MIGAAAFLLLVALSALLASLAAAVLLLALSGARAVRVALAETGGTIAARHDVAAPTHAGIVAALGLALASLALRTVAIGHAPWSTLHEFSASFACVLLAAYVLLERRQPLRPLAPIVAAVAAGLLAFALTLDARADPLVPALQQPLLLTVHVGSAVVAYAVSTIAFVAAVGEVVQRRAGDAIRMLPPAAACREAAHRCVLIAFPVLTLTIALGAVWANLAWRSPWSNDPKELAAAGTWLVYGAYLHVAGRRDRLALLAPWLLVLGFGGVLFTYVGASLWFVGEHSYAAP